MLRQPRPLLVLLTIALGAGCGGRSGPEPVGPGLARARAATVALEITGRDEQGPWASHGAGTLLHPAGYVLTCEHVTAEGTTQHVVLADGRRFPYRVLARAGHTYDLAVLAFRAPEGLVEIELGHSAMVTGGDTVRLVGNPAGQGLTSLVAVVDLPDCGGGTQLQLRHAEVVPGYSGGPVLDLAGRQIGHIHVAIRTAKGISRHIKVDHARAAFATALQEQAEAQHGLGLRVDCQGRTARVLVVVDGSPAERAGFAVGDVITRAGTMAIRSGVHWVLAALDRDPAEPLPMEVERDGRPRAFTVAPTTPR